MITDNPQLSENDFEMDFDQPAINIGSHPDNDIVLKSDGVLPFHVSLLLQDGECQVLSLDVESDVRLDGKVVQNAQFKLAGAARQLDIGANKLLLEHNKTFDSLHVRIHPAGALSGESEPKVVHRAALAASSGADSPILLNLFSQTDEVEVGQTASYELEIVNAGALVASFNIFIEGVPKEWVTISPEEINLYEGQRKRVQINITPPRHPGSTAGHHELRVSVFSANYPGQQAATPIILRIKPYYEFTLGNLSPREQSVHHFPSRRRVANTSLPVTNLGNAPADFSISSTDDENACSFDFVVADELRLNRQAALHIDAGETLLQPIEITPRKRRWINSKRYSYTTAVQVTNQAVAPQMVSGSLNSHPFISLWLIVGTILMMAIIAFIILQPGINYFRTDKAIVEPKDNTIKLAWSLVPFTDRVTISANTQPLNNGQPLINGQTSFTVTPTETTTYEIVAGNWLSGLFHALDRRETVKVLVVPPLPTINDFSVDNNTVAPGQSVNISWSVTQADQVTLTVGDSVEVLKELKGERIVPMKTDTLVALEAQNAGGEALRSHFVHVKQPEIVVKQFVVKTQLKTALRNGTAKGAALSQQSDPDTWVEYVKLVLDSNSDSGYRAFFVDDRELDKGEPVMLEWDVTGTDNEKIKITTDTLAELPAKSSKPAFPEKSMNYVLTATSGELVKIYTLPVKVFNGSPPTAPTIEFFQAVPVAILGKGEVKFSWSVSGAWTRIALINSKGVVADYVDPQGFKTVTVSESDTYILTAWNGEDLSSSKPLDITVSPALLKIGLQIESALPYPKPDRFWVGDVVTVAVKFDAAPSGKPDPTGSVIITDGSSSCSFELPITSCEFEFKTAGDKQLIASYGGDTIYVQGKSPNYPLNNAKIVVSSPGMILSPQFYLDSATGELIGSVLTGQRFEINQKLFTKIMFKPSAGRGLDDSDTGNQISYSICKNGKCDDQITANKIEIKDGRGTADILISGLPGAGEKYELRFYYNHSEHLFASTSISRSGFIVSQLKIYLKLPPSKDCAVKTSGIKDGATCSFGYTDRTAAHIKFDILQTIDDDYLDSSMVAPIFNDNTWNFTVDSVRVSSCIVRSKNLNTSTRSVHFLDCTVNIGDKPTLKANYKYKNDALLDYIVEDASKSFSLQPAHQTTIEFTQEPGYSVGTIIRLTPRNKLHLYDVMPNGARREITANAGEITFSNPEKESNLFGVVPGSSCKVNSTGDLITNIFVDQPCNIFFRKAGDWNTEINFLGDVNNAPSPTSSYRDIRVNMADQITATWFYSDNAAVNPAKNWLDIATIPVGKSITARIVFTGPGTFSANALNGVALSLTLDNCAFNPPLNSPEIVFAQQAVIDFGVRCQNTPAKSNLNIKFLDSANPQNASKDFGFKQTNDTARQILFDDGNSNYGELYFEFEDKYDKPSSIDFNWNSGSVLEKVIKPKLYAGEPYKIHLSYQPIWIDISKIGSVSGGCANGNICSTITDLLNFIQNGNGFNARSINILLPPSWKGTVKVSKVSGVCSVDSANAKIIVPLANERNFPAPLQPSRRFVELFSPDRKPNSYIFDDTNPCIVVFKYDTGTKFKALGAGEVVNFSLSENFTEPTTNTFYSAGQNYIMKNGLAKIFVKLNPKLPKVAFTQKQPVKSLPQVITMTFDTSIAVIPTGESPLDNNLPQPLFKVTFPPACTSAGGSLMPTVDAVNKKVKWTLTAPNAPCSGKLSIDYNENDFFGEVSLVSQFIQFTAP